MVGALGVGGRPDDVGVDELVGTGHPLVALVVVGSATGLLWRRIRTLPQAPALAARTVTQGVVADGAALGHMLRREWWPVGLAALIASPRSPAARLAATMMIAPIAWEWATQRPPLDPLRYTALRLVDDAAYGTGVIAASARRRTIRPLLPHLRLPNGMRRKRESRAPG